MMELVRFLVSSISSLVKEYQDEPDACYVFLGLLIGAMSGAGLGAVMGNVVYGMQLGPLSSMFIGWILTSTALQK